MSDATSLKFCGGVPPTKYNDVQVNNEVPSSSNEYLDSDCESGGSGVYMQEETDDADSEGSIYSYEYQQSDDDEDAMSVVGVKQGEANNGVTKGISVAELDDILNQMNLLEEAVGVGAGDGDDGIANQQKMDDSRLPLMKDLTEFIRQMHHRDEGLVLLALKMSPGFNRLLISLLKNDSLMDWVERKEIYSTVLEMLDLFCESDILVTMLQHNPCDGSFTYQTLIEDINAKVAKEIDLTGDGATMSQRIVSTCKKIHDTIENFIDAGTIARVTPSDNTNTCSENNSAQKIARILKPPSNEWTRFINQVPRCAAAEGICDTSVFNHRVSKASTSSPQCLKKLLKELDGLNSHLSNDPQCSIWVRFDEDTPQFIRALIAAPLPGPTPYSGGLFAFDIHIPNSYPQLSPEVKLLTTGGGRIRFGPNLYADGKRIQGMILGVEHPYFLEPGRGGWEDKPGEVDVEAQEILMKATLYEDVLRVATAEFGMAQPLRWSLQNNSAPGKHELEAFRDIIKAHFRENSDAILAEVRNWQLDETLRLSRSQALERKNSGTAGESALMIDALKVLIPQLEDLLSTCIAWSGFVSSPTTKDQEKLKPTGKQLSCTVSSSCALAMGPNKESKALAEATARSTKDMGSRGIIDQTPGIDIAELSLATKQVVVAGLSFETKLKQTLGDPKPFCLESVKPVSLKQAKSRFPSQGPKKLNTLSAMLNHLNGGNSGGLGSGEGILDSDGNGNVMDVDGLPSARIDSHSHNLGSDSGNLPDHNKEIASHVQPIPVDQTMATAVASRPWKGQHSFGANEQLKRSAEIESSDFRAVSFAILKGLQSHEHGWVFAHPVNPLELGLPDYFDKIKKPMDLGTIEQKLTNGSYQSLVDFQLDVRLTFQNAMSYNDEHTVVHEMAKELLVKFEADMRNLDNCCIRTTGGDKPQTHVAKKLK